MKYSEKTEELKSSNQQLSTRVAELKGYYDKQAKYQKDIDLINEIVTKLMEDYPADTRQEDVVMLAVELQNKYDMVISNVNMEENELVYDVPKETVKGAKIEGFDKNLQFMKKKASYANMTNYENLKAAIETIYDSPNRVGIELISYVKDTESNVLDGTIDLIFYYAKGTDKEYVCPDIEEYLMGAENIFQ